MNRDRNNDSKVYVGNLPLDIKTRDLEDIFYRYGKIVDVDLHVRDYRGDISRPFAFIEFEDPRDADDAVRERDGYSYDGNHLKVEFPRGSHKNRGGSRGRGSGGGRGGFDRGSRPRGYQLLISDLPSTGSWQDVKDHFREAGDIIYADVYKDGTGVVEFSRHDHMKRALEKLDESKFKSHEGETSYVRVKEAEQGSRSPPRRNRGRSNSRSRSRSRSR